MLIYFCSSCGATVPEKNIKSGTAVMVDGQTVHCFRCITSRVAKVSDSKVYRALLAKNSESKLKNAVRSVSQRLIAQVPNGSMKRFVTRVSERFFLPRTANYPKIGSSPRNKIGSSPRNPLPPGSSTALKAITKRKAEANNLATATAACVVLAIGTLILFMSMSKKTPVQEVVAATPKSPAKVTAPGTSAALMLPITPVQPDTTQAAIRAQIEREHTAAKAAVAARPLPATLTTPVTPSLVAKGVSDHSVVQIPPTLMERERIQSQLAVPPRAESAPAVKPKIPATPVDAAAARVPDGMDWFAAWQVDNLYKNAKAKMYEEFDGRAFVLETHPPEPAKELLLKWTVPVSADKTFFEFSARAADKSDSAMSIEIDGKKSATETLHPQWRAFALDLSAYKGKEVTVLLHHAPTGWENESAFWQAPHWVSKPARDALMLSTSGKESAATALTDSSWAGAVDLLSLIESQRDSVAGTWTVRDGSLIAEKALFGRLEIPYQPPQEYDFRILFSRQDGSDSVTQILSRSGRSFGWTMGGSNNAVFGFETINGVSAAANQTTVKGAVGLENGRKYTSVVKVRDQSVKAYLDGRLLSEWKTDYADMDIYKDWKLRNSSLLGLGSWNSTTVFHRVEMLEVTGKGAVHTEVRPQHVGDIKLEYERALGDSYKLLASRGVKAALQRIEAARAIPSMAPVGAKLATDAECFAYVQEVRQAALVGAEKLMDGRSYTFMKTDGRQLTTGGTSGNAVKDVSGESISIEQSVGTSKAQVKLDLDELALDTQAELARLALPPAVADLKLAMSKMPRLVNHRTDALVKEIKRNLAVAAKDPALASKAEHLSGHLAFLDRDSDLAERFKNFETLCRAAKWRDARTVAEEIQSEFRNSFALERLKPTMDPWIAIIERETASPLLKR